MTAPNISIHIFAEIINYEGTIPFLQKMRQISQNYSVWCKNKKLVNTVSGFKEIYHLHLFKCNLRILYYYTNITEIPFIPYLKELDCCNTDVREIPILPLLEILSCSNTHITEIPVLPNLKNYGVVKHLL
jgi:Leucine-rich repeat (LRR) protein